jgi:stage III sporulation protein AG
MGKSEKDKGGTPWWQRPGILLLGAALALGLILLGSGRSQTPRREASEQTASVDPLYEYSERMESRIRTLCESVRGVSDVRVVLSFEGDFSYVYATDSDTREGKDQTQSYLEYVTVGSGSSEQTVLLTRHFPKVSGIGIVCVGGGDGAIRQEMISLLSTALGVGSNKIYIAEANP